MTQHCDVFICKVLKSLHDSFVLHCYAGTAQFSRCGGVFRAAEIGIIRLCNGINSHFSDGLTRWSLNIMSLSWATCTMFCQDWPLPRCGYTFFPGYMQLQALCAPYKRGKPSGTMTKQTGLIPVTLFCFLSPARCCLPALVSPSLACKILKWFWLECVPSQHLPHPYCHTITCHLINNANMGGSMSNLSPLERHGVRLECWNWSCFCAIPTGTCSRCRSQNASDGELWIINAM